MCITSAHRARQVRQEVGRRGGDVVPRLTCLCLLSVFAVAAGTRGYDQIHQPGEPGRVPPPHCRPAGHRHVLHCLVLRVSFHCLLDMTLCVRGEHDIRGHTRAVK